MSETLEHTLRKAERLHAAGDIQHATVLYRSILTEHPYFSHTAFNLANILKDQLNYPEAEMYFRQALAAEPDLAAAALNLAFVLQEQGKYAEAISINTALVHHLPEISDAQFNLACLHLLMGNLCEGWPGYEQRFSTQMPVSLRHAEIPLWNGELHPGLRLLVHTEQGYGDSLQMCRYLPLLAQAGIQVWLETTPELAALFRKLPGLSGCIIRGGYLPDFDCQAPIMSLPGLMRTTLQSIPPPAKFETDQQLIRQLGDLLPSTGMLRVGFCWAGRLDLPANRKRSCPPQVIRGLLEQRGINAISLQLGHPAELAITDPRLYDCTNQLTDFHRTAALLANLDLVITIDSAIAHLAGTMGTPTWLMLPYVPDWRWLLERGDSPWYPFMQIFRQSEPGDWATVIRAISEKLAERVSDQANNLINHGAALDNQGAFQEALHCYQTALAMDDTSAIGWYNMGNTLKSLALPDQAEHAYLQALHLTPDIPEAHHNLAVIYKEQNLFPEAYRHLRRALELRPRFADVLHTLGELYLGEERFTDAIATLRTALDCEPQDSRIWNTLGITYQCAERDLEAKQCYEEALQHNQHHLHALNNLGAACLSLGQLKEGIGHLQRLVAASPDYADGHWNLAGCLLAAGQYTEGWQEYEWRWRKNNPIEARHQQIPRWDGQPLAGRHILLWAEQGFGDTFQFIRYTSQVAALGGRIVLECQTEAIRQLCRSAKGVEQVIIRGEQVPPVAVQAPLLSLPGLLGTVLETIPTEVPYLTSNADLRQQWSERIASDSGMRIGLVWGGRQTLRNRRRSCHLADFAPLAQLPNVTFYSLQIGEQAEEATSSPDGMVLHDLTHHIRDFSDTAAFIDALDLVITIDTSVAHLAGALGKPTRILLPTAADWRWLTARSDSPWYPTATLLRQRAAGEWHSTISQITAELTVLLQGVMPPPVEQHMENGDRLKEREQWQGAHHCYLLALALAPCYPLAHLRAGGSLLFLNRHTEAINHLQRAIQLNHADPAAHITLALAYLAIGNNREGWREFEWRRQNITEPFPPITELPPLHRDQRLDGTTILVHCEQGFGDMIQLARYLPALINTGATVVLSAPRELTRLFSSISLLHVVTHGERLPAAHYQTLLMSLPHLLAELVPTVPQQVPYLTAPQQLITDWQQRLAQLPGLKVGIAWQGRDMEKSGYRRALSFEQLAPLFTIPDVSFVTLQPGAFPAEAAKYANIHDQSVFITDFTDTAALITNLDLVISVDTAVAHLTGALGRTCWIALLAAPDWRWFPLQQNASSWYPTATLFRQDTPGEWQPVVAQLAIYLTEEALVRRAHQLGEQGLQQAAIEKFREAARSESASCSTWLNLGIYLHAAGQTRDGLEALRHAVTIKPDYAEAWQNMGMLHQADGDVVAAYTCFRRALAIRPDYPAAKWNLGLLQILLGDFTTGFKNFEQRFLKPDATAQRHSHLPRWQGEQIVGASLLVHAEQGYGDTIQFLRYLPRLSALGIKVIVEVQDRSLAALARSVSGSHTVITRDVPSPAADFQIPMLSLPVVCGTTVETIPPAPYCSADSTKSLHWQQRLASYPGLKVGLVWAGSRGHKNNANRSIPFQDFRSITSVPGITFFSLQVGADTLPSAIPGIIDLTRHINDYSDTAAFLHNLDMLITVDTSCVHLAGALGVPTWLLLPFAPDWRWLLGCDDTPWYPSLRLFRQESSRQWHSVLTKVVHELAAHPALMHSEEHKGKT